ncbi:F-box associated ubiquitination effector family protein [Striga asiatica]|uniref:F-box associated ubiquitination effector family protein n=1 Tax=Striga asiatica TaxID=4170 RepID=A0A5A7NYC7_STRAF|nr:F-box associated ubiquitination effector family protein [Striga asiatica]
MPSINLTNIQATNLNYLPIGHELAGPKELLVRTLLAFKVKLGAPRFQLVLPAERNPRPCEFPGLTRGVKRHVRAPVVMEIDGKLIRRVVERHSRNDGVHHPQGRLLAGIGRAYEYVDGVELGVLRQPLRVHRPLDRPPPIGLVQDPEEGENNLGQDDDEVGHEWGLPGVDYAAESGESVVEYGENRGRIEQHVEPVDEEVLPHHTADVERLSHREMTLGDCRNRFKRNG